MFLTLLTTIIIFCSLQFAQIIIFWYLYFEVCIILICCFYIFCFCRNRICIVAITRFITHIIAIILKIHLELHITDIHILKSTIFLISEIFEVKQNIFILQVLRNVFLLLRNNIIQWNRYSLKSVYYISNKIVKVNVFIKMLFSWYFRSN